MSITITQLNPQVAQLTSNINKSQYDLINIARKKMYADWVAPNDNKFILYKSIWSDYQMITYVLSSIYDLNGVDFNSLYCILRSMLEKYADFVNLVIYGEKYMSYLEYLHKNSLFQATKNEEYKKLEKKFLQETKENFKGKNRYFNRKSRYYLIKDFEKDYLFSEMNNQIPLQIINMVKNFNNRLCDLDSEYSQIIHNNLTPLIFYGNNNASQKATDIIKKAHCIMFVSSYLFRELYCKDMWYVSNNINYSMYQDMWNVLNQIYNVFNVNSVCVYRNF